MVRTAAMSVRFSEQDHCSSVTDANPLTRGVTPPALLMRTSIRPSVEGGRHQSARTCL